MTKKGSMPMVEASPYKSAAEELAALRKSLRLACRCYMERVEMEIIRVHEQVVTAGMAAATNESRKNGAAPATGAPRPKVAGGSGRAPASNGGRLSAVPEAGSEIADLRDMLTLLRTLEIKPEQGRRKDLKKIESLVEELRILSERWG